MKKITIIGAGQAGLLLGIALLAKKYDVTIVSNRSGDDIQAGQVMSSQSMYNSALDYERELGLNFWDEECPPIEGVHMRAGGATDKLLIDWTARMKASGKSVDQRIKMPRWMKEFQKRGGKLDIREVGGDDLEHYAAGSDLVIVSTGKGDLCRLFLRDHERSQFDRPMRTIALTYVHGMLPKPDHSALNISINPGVGEYVNFPALTKSGPCDIINLESIEGGPMDRWSEAKTPEQHLAMTKRMIESFFPWEAPRCKNIRLTDNAGILVGRIVPTVRKPVATLPSGARILGMADVVVLNDPITGQGANNASKCAKLYAECIFAHGDAPFDQNWMKQTFERYWDYVQWVVRFTNTHLLPPPPQVLKVFAHCGANPAMAGFIADAFDDAKSLAPWYYDPAQADRFIERFGQT